MLFLLFKQYHIETIITVLELILQLTLLQIMFVKFRYLNDARTVLAYCQHFALLEAMNIVDVIVLELGVQLTAVIAHLTVLLRMDFW
jgi:hypothetical protein